ncbi:DNA damage-inducible protein DIN7 [Elysia marginata]|uniref:DNA damage-inducible protein DIN7 n=1 Tax=Elysia marginata TaxID=1093978 RepID=A0AAV4FMT8_9GAST|nr:DNA damage-inducible protein DIN7 [Elysia marginata]
MSCRKKKSTKDNRNTFARKKRPPKEDMSDESSCDSNVSREDEVDLGLLSSSEDDDVHNGKSQTPALYYIVNTESIGKILIFDTGCGYNRRQIDVSQIAKTLGRQMYDALLGVHAFTGCDTTSCFAGKGKLRALNIIQKEEDLKVLFSRFGTSLVVSYDDCLLLESFVCKLHGKTLHTSVNKVRYDIVRQRFKGKKASISCNGGIDLCQMPPCNQVLLLHIQRANFQTLIWRNPVFQNPVIPKPEENGWQRNSVHELEVQWYKDNFIPDELTKIVADDIGSRPEDEDEGDEENYDSDFLVDTSEDDEESVVSDDTIPLDYDFLHRCFLSSKKCEM